jgi:predicted dehydrogenase
MPAVMNGTIRVGILGCSDIACRKFIPALLQSRQATLSAVASRQPEKAIRMVHDSAVPVMNYQQLIDSPDIDLIYLSLPNHLHEQWSIAALEHGKHVLCEKPLGLEPGSVNRMLAAATQNNRLLYENLMYLQHPQHHAVKAYIASGRIGRVVSLHSEFAFPGPVKGDFRFDPAMGGGAFHDMNRYPLSAAMFFLDGTSFQIARARQDVRDGLTCLFEAEAVTDAGERFSFLTAFGQSYRSFYEICGELGSIRVERAYTTPADIENVINVTIGGRDASFRVPPADHFLNTIEHVCALIHGGQWQAQYEQTRGLARLAGMFLDYCKTEVTEDGR